MKVAVYQPMWGWTAGVQARADSTGNIVYNNTVRNQVDGDYNYAGQASTNWSRNAQFRTHEFVYTYYVPCLNYKTISQ